MYPMALKVTGVVEMMGTVGAGVGQGAGAGAAAGAGVVVAAVGDIGMCLLRCGS